MVRFTGVLADGRYCIYVLHLHNALAAIAAAVDAAAAEAKSHHVENCEDVYQVTHGTFYLAYMLLIISKHSRAFPFARFVQFSTCTPF